MTLPEEKSTPFGRYILHSLLAEGGMAEIFVAEHVGAKDVSQILAVKRMLPHLCRQQEFVTMFLDEARIVSRFSHPNIVSIFDFGEVEGRYYMAMEYLSGENLTTVLKKAYGTARPIPIPVVLHLVAAVCDALHYAHGFAENGKPLNVVHRDISPTNIVVTYQGGVKVVDFGIARAIDRQAEATKTGMVKGKVPYCSPEQLLGEDIDHRSDIFSLGVVLYESLTGRRLFKRDNELKTSMAVLEGEIPKPSLARQGIPPELDQVVGKALNRDVGLRYQTCQEFRRDLEKLMQGAPPRLDDYMLELFGEEHIKKRKALRVSQAQPNTPIRHDSFPGVRTDGKGLKLDSSARRDTGVPSGLGPESPTHTAPKHVPAGGIPDTAPSRSALSKPVLLGALAVLVVAGFGVGYWTVSRSVPPTPTPTSIPTPLAPPPTVLMALATLDVDTLPRGATIEVGGKKAPGVSPLRLTELTPGDLVVMATLEGYGPVTEVVKLESGGAKSVVLKLAPVEAPLKVKPTAKKLGPGKLDVQCAPWCQVLIDGTDVGRPSPIVGLSVPAGQHKLTLIHTPTGRSKEVVIQVQPGQTVHESASFR
jgi:eukaryotic-like serine/threonine-protein kinase